MIDDLLPDEREFDALGASMLDRSRRADRRRRRRTIAAAAAITLAAAGVGTAWVVLANQEMRYGSTFCYGEPEISGPERQVVRGDYGADDRDENGMLLEPETSADHIAKCAALWRVGDFEPGGIPGDGTEVFPVPDLTVCLRQDGTHAVFPTDPARPELCTDLGLREPLR